ncbi:MAG: magnesium and cobalt transport protein CorA [Gammaproteobacteria bacterium]|nr:magnesium and cobalt transport protein CorA [Gammaproteobacteria bacterium]
MATTSGEATLASEAAGDVAPALVNCVAYQDGKRIGEPTVPEISDYLLREGCFVWVALRNAGARELALMQEEFQLHALAVEDASHGHQRPKIEDYDESLFVVMHLIDSVDGDLIVGEVNVFVGENYVLSVRSRSNQTFVAVRERCEREPELMKHGAGFVLYALMDAVVDRYFPILDMLETELETIEASIFSQARGVARSNIEALYTLKSKVTLLKHAVAPLLDAAGRLAGSRAPRVCAQTPEYFRDVNDHLARVNASIDAMRETIGTAMSVNLAMVTIEENEITKKLAAWAGIFAVATAFAGIWGMNFVHMPELDSPWGYPVALGLIASSCGIIWWRFRKAGWL